MFAANSGFKIQVVWLVTQFDVILVQVGLQFIDLWKFWKENLRLYDINIGYKISSVQVYLRHTLYEQ